VILQRPLFSRKWVVVLDGLYLAVDWPRVPAVYRASLDVAIVYSTWKEALRVAKRRHPAKVVQIEVLSGTRVPCQGLSE
jgi:hypothetical protein